MYVGACFCIQFMVVRVVSVLVRLQLVGPLWMLECLKLLPRVKSLIDLDAAGAKLKWICSC